MNPFYTPIYARVEIRECNHIVAYDLGGGTFARVVHPSWGSVETPGSLAGTGCLPALRIS